MGIMGSLMSVTQRKTAGADNASAQARIDRQNRAENYNTKEDPFQNHPMNCKCQFHR